jgi:acetyl-CoA carboxylase biotin carboxylase subunit
MFKKILVANRGEIAVRIIRACKEEGIQTVAVHSDVDRESLHVKMADESVCIGPAKPTASYLNIPAILSAAHLTNADAIHPGYGFLAENEEFAAVCEKSKIVFIGPAEKDIALMGNKIEARKAMAKLGVPVLPGAEVDSKKSSDILRAAEKVGYPLILKAAFGGGGRGMKIVLNPEQLVASLETARSEAGAAFGDETVYMERYIQSARHIEFQVAADKKGNIVVLGERDCTVQRRHQKLIEESPSPLVSEDLRNEMTEIISRALKKIDYSNVGTIELLMDEKQRLYFMEMNTRVQVEHPVTEMVTGVDIVKLQIALADGAKLNLSQKQIRLNGHSIECRINAEDSVNFRPSVGTISTYHVPGGYGIRVDSALYDGYKVLPFYDSMLAKLIVHGRDRNEAIQKMKCALDELVIEGLNTNIDFHKKVMRHELFNSANYDTTFAQQLSNE